MYFRDVLKVPNDQPYDYDCSNFCGNIGICVTLYT